MVTVSRETPEQTALRLERVIKQARLTVYQGVYVFEEFALADFPRRADPKALALVRDDQIWSQLVEQPPGGPAPHQEAFCLWRFHFPDGLDNSGFVGWLASRLKDRFGTGVFVVCGQNSGDGGIFDYWGGPHALRDELIAEITQLAQRDRP